MERYHILGQVALWRHMRFLGTCVVRVAVSLERVSILEEHFCYISLHRDTAGTISMPGMIIPSEVGAGHVLLLPSPW